MEKYGITGDLLIWLKSYLTNRTQRVILKDSLSCIGELKAGVPQGSVLGPLLFLVFINDIADDMVGFGRLFADDTSIGHTANNEQNLQLSINLDLVYLNSWSEKWLLKFNPSKTDIMIFNAQGIHSNLFFDFGGNILNPVSSHKHLGVIFSSDCKWTKHIDMLVERASKQLTVLRKLKFRLKREYLEKIYFTFIRPILEYASEVWDNCGQINSDRLEKIQIEAARIVTGLPIYASVQSIYRETGWEKLSTRREVRKILMFYKITFNLAPEYLYDLVPPNVSEISNYNLRNSQNISVPLYRISIYQNSFFPSCIKLWNSLDPSLRQLPTISSFKLRMHQLYFKNKKPPLYYYHGDRIASMLHARLRNACSILNSDLFKANLIENANCLCGHNIENAEHFLMECRLFHLQRDIMVNSINALNLNIIINTELLLFGSEILSYDDNLAIFVIVQKYIKDSCRFSYKQPL